MFVLTLGVIYYITIIIHIHIIYYYILYITIIIYYILYYTLLLPFLISLSFQSSSLPIPSSSSIYLLFLPNHPSSSSSLPSQSFTILFPFLPNLLIHSIRVGSYMRLFIFQTHLPPLSPILLSFHSIRVGSPIYVFIFS